MAEQRDNSGAMFKNDKKTTDAHPEYRGPCMVNGKEMEVAAWIKKSAAGKTYMSLAFSEPWKPDGAKQAPKREAKKDDGVPF